MSMTNALKGTASVRWGDKTVRLTPLDLDGEGMFEEWLKAKERRELASLKGILDPLDYAKTAAEWVRCAAAGDYAYTSENGQKALRTQEGVQEFVRLLMLPEHPGVKPATVKRFIAACWPEIDLVIQDFFTRKAAAAKAAAEASKARASKNSSPATVASSDDLEAGELEQMTPTATDDLTDDLEDSGSTPPMTPTGIYLGGNSSNSA